MIPRRAAVLSACAIALALAACSSASTSPSPGGGMVVADAWARPSMGMDNAGAVYLTITNETARDDALVGVATPAAEHPEIHRTTEDASGMMGMHPVERLNIPAGGTVTLEPGGFHVMLIDLTGELTAGETIDLTLSFEEAGDVEVSAEVRAG